MKTMTSRQFYALIFFATVVGKFLYLPSVLGTYAGKDAYFVTLFWFLIDAIFLMGALYFIKNSKHNFFTKLKDSTNKSIYKMLLFLYTIYFFLKTCLIILESTELFEVSFYSGLVRYEFFILLFILILFSVSLSFKAFSRSLEILKPLFILGLLFVIIVGLVNANVLFSLPILQSGLSPILNTATKSIFWFGDFIILFLFLNKVKTNKHFYRQSILHYVIASFFVIIFMFLFYNTFNELSAQKTLAIYNLLENMSGASIFNKLDWLFVSFWSLGLLFGVVLFSYATFSFFKKLFVNLKPKVSALILIFLLFLLLLFFNFQIINFYVFIQNASYLILILQYIIPILLFLLFYNKKERMYEKNKMEKT